MIDETVREIEEMQTQSSSIVAVKAAQALRELTERECHTVEDFNRVVERNSSALQRANRSHAPLYTTQQRIVEAVKEADADTVEEAKDVLVEAIEDVVTEVESSKARAAERASELVDDGDVLLTHENSSTVMATYDEVVDAGKEVETFVTESRPRFLGRKTARQLAKRDGVDVTLITDGAAGHYLEEVDRVLIGMNCLIEDVVYNRIGTHSVVASAASYDVPVTAVGSSSKFIGGGFTFENTFRPASEVMLEPADGFAVANPGYDATPTRLLDSVVTENAVIEF
jgi:translation initiation factor eIF-2B subunit delta